MAHDADITHVLSWLPARFMPGSREGCWELRSIAAHEAGSPPEYDGADLPEFAGAEDLALVVGEQVGFPVTLSPGSVDLRLPRRFARWSTEPLFFVRRAS